MIRLPIYQKAVDAYWKQRSLTDDEFYFGLGDRIKQRQESKVPVAGAGTVEFLQLLGTVTTGVAIFVPFLRPVVKVISFAEETVRDKSGLTE